ncbi:hypothetical protein E2C01_011449 [Portunus trituberculatus]|uniref:Uncharacterized protein n=1 Tax=Portunus trituberculatus TaxID=210409 RepID=A0A5B7DB83_PORTR|nr:hypothetical protein [Portunus trituberculatus]
MSSHKKVTLRVKTTRAEHRGAGDYSTPAGAARRCCGAGHSKHSRLVNVGSQAEESDKKLTRLREQQAEAETALDRRGRELELLRRATHNKAPYLLYCTVTSATRPAAIPIVIPAGSVGGATVLHRVAVAFAALLLVLRHSCAILLEVPTAVILGEVLLFHLLVCHWDICGNGRPKRNRTGVEWCLVRGGRRSGRAAAAVAGSEPPSQSRALASGGGPTPGRRTSRQATLANHSQPFKRAACACANMDALGVLAKIIDWCRSVFSSASRSASCFSTGPLLTGEVREEPGAERFGDRFRGVTGAECPMCLRVVAGDADAERTVRGVVGGLYVSAVRLGRSRDALPFQVFLPWDAPDTEGRRDEGLVD